MKILITGGAGFIGRWVVKKILDLTNDTWVLDDLSNANKKNLEDLRSHPNFKEFFKESILNQKLLKNIFQKVKFDLCIHLAAQINVQESINDPDKSFKVNVIGTQNLLNECRINNVKFVLVSTCMVYDTANLNNPIEEDSLVKPASPYAGSKLAAENMALSYYFAYKLPVVVLRPFNTYGPFQKANMEGGVVSIFVNNEILGKNLKVFGTGEQTRDLLYVEDCADFIVKASYSEDAIGEIINGGLGKDISINELAKLIIKDENKIEHIPHHHPQSEIMKLLCNNTKAKKLLKWKPTTSLEEGINKLRIWIKKNMEATR